MKVASFNVNSIRARLGIVTEWVGKEAPDVLCLQETKVQDAAFPLETLKGIGYHCAFSGEKSYNGVAILSRSRPGKVRKGFGGDGSEKTRIISAEIEGVWVVNTYVPQGFLPLSAKFRYKLDWFARLYGYFEANFNPSDPVLWVGDFNVAPAPEDVYDPELLGGHVGFHPDEHAALERFREWGFVDVFRMHDRSEGRFTFWDYRIRNAVKRGLGWRVDHIWATRILAERSVRAWIDTGPRLKPRPSDHAPVVAEFDL